MMTSNLSTNQQTASDRWAQLGFYEVAVLFNLCLIAQVFTIGVAYFNDPAWWTVHVWLVRGYGGLSLILMGRVVYHAFLTQNTASRLVLLGKWRSKGIKQLTGQLALTAQYSESVAHNPSSKPLKRKTRDITQNG